MAVHSVLLIDDSGSYFWGNVENPVPLKYSSGTVDRNTGEKLSSYYETYPGILHVYDLRKNSDSDDKKDRDDEKAWAKMSYESLMRWFEAEEQLP